MKLEILSRVAWSPVSPAPRPKRARSLKRWLTFSIGGVCAVGMAELSVRSLTTALDNQWDPLGSESSRTPVREVRRYTEGIAKSHFTSSRKRLTGHLPVLGGVDGIILGDSYVEALQVRDNQTMGAVLERSLRATGRKVNVHQYGWSGVDIPYYVFIAPDVIRLWDPAWVVVVITANDLAPNLLSGRYRLVRGSDGWWEAQAKPEQRRSHFRRVSETVLTRSSLLYQLSKRAQEAGVPLVRSSAAHGDGPGSTQAGALSLPQRSRIALAALRDGYGDRLRILFVADVGLDGRTPESPAEKAVLSTCRRLMLRCAGTRRLMNQDRLASQRLARGFINSAPGAGHLNPTGHALTAETIRRDLINP